MKTIVDKFIPFLPHIPGQIVLDPLEITPDVVRDADAMLIRTRTKCNESLLAGSSVRFIATATIGFDHIDMTYCRNHNIYATNCPGCNAQGVCDYVESALEYIHDGSTIGVVGCGHVGSLVVQMAERRGLNVLRYDPFLGYMDDVTKADIITFHTPLTRTGSYPSFHMANDVFFARLRSGVSIINAARGGVVDELALMHAMDKGIVKHAIIDTWEGEPRIKHPELVQRADIATFHIAGYTLQGKVNASTHVLDEYCRFFNLPAMRIVSPAAAAPLNKHWLEDIDRTFKAKPDAFEYWRETYPLRADLR